MGRILTTKKGRRLYQDDNGIIYETTTGKNPGRTLANYRNGSHISRIYNLPASVKGNNVNVRTYDEESAKEILRLSGIPKSKAQIQREKVRAKALRRDNSTTTQPKTTKQNTVNEDYDILQSGGINRPLRRFKKYVTAKRKVVYKDIDNGLYYNNLNQNEADGLSPASFSKKNAIKFIKSNNVSAKPVTLPELVVTAPRIKKNNNSNNVTKRRDLTTNIPKNNVTRRNTGSNVTPKRSYSRTSSSTSDGNYTVNRGDSLWRIAHNAGISLNELMRQNPQIKSINQVIHPGDKINVNGKRNINNTNISTPSINTSTPATSTPNYDNIILDDSKMQTNINTTPSQEQLNVPNKLEPIKYNYKKKKR